MSPVGQRLVRRENINLPVGDPYSVKARRSDPISNIPFPAFCLQVLGQLTVTSSGQGRVGVSVFSMELAKAKCTWA